MAQGTGEASKEPAQDSPHGGVRGLAREVHGALPDGHAGVSSEHIRRPEHFPPFLLQETEGGIVAFLQDRSSFVDEEHPYVVSIDGLKVEKWIERASEWEAKGSSQLVRRRALRGLRNLALLRTPRESQTPEVVRLKLRGKGRSKAKEIELPMQSRRPTYGSWPQGESRILEGDLGYLRLPAMDDELVPALHASMSEFRETKGLIVDVRGNGGGSRSLLLALARISHDVSLHCGQVLPWWRLG
ncbi:MAG: S41 family peptidase, partial [Planctomycetota bacterium]